MFSLDLIQIVAKKRQEVLICVDNRPVQLKLNNGRGAAYRVDLASHGGFFGFPIRYVGRKLHNLLDASIGREYGVVTSLNPNFHSPLSKSQKLS